MDGKVTTLRPGRAATLVSDPPTETAAQLSARLTREALCAGKLVVGELVDLANAFEAKLLEIADLQSLPPGVREACRTETAHLPGFVQGVEAIMNRSAR